jgi:hypothetical protein
VNFARSVLSQETSLLASASVRTTQIDPRQHSSLAVRPTHHRSYRMPSTPACCPFVHFVQQTANCSPPCLSNKLPRCISRPSLVSHRCPPHLSHSFQTSTATPKPSNPSQAKPSQCQSRRLLFTRRTPIGSATTPPRLQRLFPARVRARRSSLTQCGHVCDGPLFLTTHSISPSMLGQSPPTADNTPLADTPGLCRAWSI